jgi:hypothetical protein
LKTSAWVSPADADDPDQLALSFGCCPWQGGFVKPISYFEGLAVDRLLLDAEGRDVGPAIELIAWGRIKASM